MTEILQLFLAVGDHLKKLWTVHVCKTFIGQSVFNFLTKDYYIRSTIYFYYNRLKEWTTVVFQWKDDWDASLRTSMYPKHAKLLPKVLVTSLLSINATAKVLRENVACGRTVSNQLGIPQPFAFLIRLFFIGRLLHERKRKLLMEGFFFSLQGVALCARSYMSSCSRSGKLSAVAWLMAFVLLSLVQRLWVQRASCLRPQYFPLTHCCDMFFCCEFLAVQQSCFLLE